MEKSAITLVVLTIALLAFVVFQQSKMGPKAPRPSEPKAEPKPEPTEPVQPEVLGRRSGRAKTSGCENVKIGSPDFARCSTDLGSGRTVLAGDPKKLANPLRSEFVSNEFTPAGAAKFRSAKKGKKTAKAFPFSESRPSRADKKVDADKVFDKNGELKKAKKFDLSKRSTQGSSLGANALFFQSPPAEGETVGTASHSEGTKFLGAAVSPSAMGASKEEIIQASQIAVETRVSSNTDGNLNLLHPL